MMILTCTYVCDAFTHVEAMNSFDSASGISAENVGQITAILYCIEVHSRGHACYNK